MDAGAVVNATGVWSDAVSELGDSRHQARMRPAKGVHIAVPWSRLSIDCTVTVSVPGRARRATCTRWGDVVLLGTTDTDYAGPLDDVVCTRDEMLFLLDGVNTVFDAELTPTDVIGSIAGLRPLSGREGATIDLRRDHHIRTEPNGMVTITGGKLTTARHMAELGVDAVGHVLGADRRCRTTNLPLLGAAGYDAEASTATGGIAAHLAERYGTEASFVSTLIREDSTLATPVVHGSPYLKAEVVYAARCELARSVDDVLSRRTRMRLFSRDASTKAAPVVASLLQKELGLSHDEVARQVEQYTIQIARETAALVGGHA